MNRSFFSQYLYYCLIAIVSLVVLFFLPMLGSEVGLAWKVPTTPVGWIVWVMTNLFSAGLNLLIFHAFIKQAKLNISDDKRYLEAKDILQKKLERDYQNGCNTETPLSPKDWFSREYRRKGVSLAIFTLLGMIGLSNAILTFDPIRFFTQLVSLVIAIIFGVIEMKVVEEYWTNGFHDYAIFYKKDEFEQNDEINIVIDETKGDLKDDTIQESNTTEP